MTTFPPRIALVHATALAMAPIQAAFERHWPQAVRMNLLDDSLSVDRARAGALTEAMVQRFIDLARYAAGTGCQGILFTCSAFGPAIEAAGRATGLPTLKPNEAMVADAVACGQRVGLIASFAPTLQSMPAEFPAGVELRTALVAQAMTALDQGDCEAHDAAVLAAAHTLVAQGCGVIALAQFSMARAAPLLRRQLPAVVSVLTTPDSAVAALRRRLVPTA